MGFFEGLFLYAYASCLCMQVLQCCNKPSWSLRFSPSYASGVGRCLKKGAVFPRSFLSRSSVMMNFPVENVVSWADWCYPNNVNNRFLTFTTLTNGLYTQDCWPTSQSNLLLKTQPHAWSRDLAFFFYHQCLAAVLLILCHFLYIFWISQLSHQTDCMFSTLICLHLWPICALLSPV